MLKTLFSCVATLALSAASLPSALAATVPSNETTALRTAGTPPAKTSDRTPGDPAPHRTPNANLWGAAGVDRAMTDLGTSDRTPENHYRPVSQ